MAEPIVYINGKRHVLPLGRAEVTLLQYLRGEAHEDTSSALCRL